MFIERVVIRCKVFSEDCNSVIEYADFLWLMVMLYREAVSGILMVIWPDIFKDGGRKIFCPPPKTITTDLATQPSLRYTQHTV